MESQSQTDVDQRSTWAKIEVMGHETYYGWIEPSPWLASGIRAHILPAGEDEDKDPSLTKDWGESAIFGITPLPEEKARALSRRSHYKADVLGYAEQEQLVTERIEKSEALDIVRDAGYKTVEEDAFKSLADGLASKMASLQTLVEKFDLGDEVESVLMKRADSARRTLNRHAPNALHRLRSDGDSEPGDLPEKLPFE